MTNMTLSDRILKTDTLGRVKTPAERREALVEEFEKSGMSGTKFAEYVGIKYQTFASWVSKRRRRHGLARKQSLLADQPADTTAKLQWVEAVVEKDAAVSGKGALSVHLPGGARLEVADARQAALAAELLRALRS